MNGDEWRKAVLSFGRAIGSHSVLESHRSRFPDDGSENDVVIGYVEVDPEKGHYRVVGSNRDEEQGVGAYQGSSSD